MSLETLKQKIQDFREIFSVAKFKQKVRDVYLNRYRRKHFQKLDKKCDGESNTFLEK